MKCVAAYTSDVSTMASRAPDSRVIAVCMAPRRKVSSMSATVRPVMMPHSAQAHPVFDVERLADELPHVEQRSS